MIYNIRVFVLLIVIFSGCNAEEKINEFKRLNEFKMTEILYTSPDGRLEVIIKYDTTLEREHIIGLYSQNIDDLRRKVEDDYRVRNERGLDIDSGSEPWYDGI